MAIGETQIIAQPPSLSRLLNLYLQHRTNVQVQSIAESSLRSRILGACLGSRAQSSHY